MDRTIDRAGDDAERPLATAVVVAAHDEADRIGATLAALATAFPGVPVWVADDGSRDGTADVARAAGAHVVSLASTRGKGQAMTAAVREALDRRPGGREDVFLLCDGDLGESAARLGALAALAGRENADLAVATFARRRGGGFGLALGFAGWAIESRVGLETRAPISGQRALRRWTLEAALPFAAGYGMEIGMTIDAVRAGARIAEIELDLSHRATGRTAAGFVHRGRQLAHFARTWWLRR